MNSPNLTSAGAQSPGGLPATPEREVAQLLRRLELQKLLGEVSTQFINLPAEEIDAHINQTLARVAGFLGFNLLAISKFVGEGSKGEVTHVWTAEGLPKIPPGFTELDFPWTAERITQGHTVHLSSLDDLPPAGCRDRQTYESLSIRSAYNWPLRVAGAAVGCLGLVSVGETRPFPHDFAEEIQLLAHILANTLARTRADLALRESETRLNLAAEAAGAGLWILDVASGRYWLTAKNRELFAFNSQEEVTFESVMARIHPEDREPVRRVVAEVLRTGCDGSVEYRVAMPDGNLRWMSSRGRSDGINGQPQRLMGVTVDVTERKRAEEELRASYSEIERLKERLQAESDYLKAEIKVTQSQGEIIGKSEPIRKALLQVQQVAPTDASVLLLGETGTGKELIAQAIHRHSFRRDRVLVKVNCAALPSALVESELFGREKGAFTGALTRQIGRFELADGSTVFLDEVGELSLEVQAKLLRVLQSGEFERLGNPKTLRANVRVVAATNRNLLEQVRTGQFREDLYYRLSVFPIRVPPLRERAEDIPLLVWQFLEEFSSRMGKKITQIPRKTMEALQLRPWPGNVRQLRNVIEHAAIISPGNTLLVPMAEEVASTIKPPHTLAESEREHILQTLERTGWRIKGPRGAAILLGLKPSTLYSRMRKLAITSPLPENSDTN